MTEKTDANVRVVAYAAIVLAFVSVLVAITSRLVLQVFSRPSFIFAGLPQRNQLPPEPRLEANPQKDLLALRRQEDALLNDYGWVDRPKGIVRIPIERAIELTAKRGLPSRPSAEKQ
jgi:hypothetical protein